MLLETVMMRSSNYKRYLDELPGVSIQNLWDDISGHQLPLKGTARLSDTETACTVAPRQGR